MNPERYRQLDELFRGALAVPEAVRAAWLEARCGADAALRAEVEALLAHDRSPRVSLAGSPGRRLASAGDARATDAHAGDDPTPPIELPGYRFMRPIGAGGMGVVWEAEQHHPPRTVAIKVLRPGLSSEGMLRRFATEIRALARMDHPGVARIHDAGVAEVRGEPHPYLVMELVRGLPLLEWAERARLDARGRCELLARVAEAVQGAHAKGVIHRDLKRSNVLVEAGGQPRVLDFGVARLVEGESAGALGTRATHTGQLVGSLETMSPEQASGRPDTIDVRTDVYSLGCMLYELLTGRPPFDFHDVPLPEAVRRIHEEEPASLASRDRHLAGDLETIVHKALAKDPRARYGSASELAADLRRHLEDLPILARPATTLYQLRKFARRHRAQAAGLGIALAALAVSFVAVLVFARREHAERQRAERNAASLRQRLLRESLTSLRRILDGDDPSEARANLARLPEGEASWEQAWLAARVATVDGPDLPTGAQVYQLVRAGPGFLASGHRDRTVRRYDVARASPVASVLTRGRVLGLAASADGSVLAAATAEPTTLVTLRADALVRDADTTAVAPPPGPESPGIPAPLALDTRGTWAAFATAPRRLALWELPSGTTRWELESEGALTALAADPWDGTLLAATRTDLSRLERLDPRDGSALARHTLEGPAVERLGAFAPGRVAAVAGRTLLLWQPERDATLAVEMEDPIGALEPIPGSAHVLVGDAGGRILEVDLDTGAILRTLHGSYRDLTALCPFAEQGLVAAGYSSGRVEFLELDGGRVVMAHASVAPDPVYAMVAVPERGGVAVAQSNHIRFFPLPRPAFHSLRHGSYVYGAAELGGRGLWATTGWDSHVRLWDARGWTECDSIALDECGLDLCADREGTTLFVTTRSGRITCLEVDAGDVPELHARWRSVEEVAPAYGVRMALAPDGARVLRTTDVRIVATRVQDGTPAGAVDLGESVAAIAFGRGGGLGAVTLKRFCELDPATLALRRALPLPDEGSALAPDGAGGWWIGLSSGRLLRLAPGASVPRPVAELDAQVLALALSPDGKRLATGTRGGVVSLLDPSDGFRLLDLDPHVPTLDEPTYFYVRDLDWSHDGRVLVSSSGDGTARVWEAP